MKILINSDLPRIVTVSTNGRIELVKPGAHVYDLTTAEAEEIKADPIISAAMKSEGFTFEVIGGEEESGDSKAAKLGVEELAKIVQTASLAELEDLKETALLTDKAKKNLLAAIEDKKAEIEAARKAAENGGAE